ncbi:MAG TPA: hypothetical protein VFY18_06890 [Candidatus Limnocylindrales bacterium]|nr:hypothetical protein [Candidatus Limnocylindrales bacterium]
MKRVLALLVSLTLVLALPAAASAGRVTRFTDHNVSIFCEGMAATSGGGFAFFSASVSSEFGPDAFVDFFATSDTSGPPDLFRASEQPVVVSWNGSVLAGSIPLLNSNGDPAGSAAFSATLAASGDPSPFDDRFRDGNHWHQFTGVDQPMDPSGTLSVGGSTFSLDTCFGNESTVSVFETNPRSFVNHFASREVGCDLTNAAGDTGFLFTSLRDGEVFIDAGAFPADGSAGTGASGSATLANGVLDANLETYNLDTGEPVAGGASIHLAVVGSGEPFDYILKFATGKLVAQGVTLDLEGTLTIGTRTFDLGACIGVDGRTKVINSFPNGPKPGGKVPSNDLPSGAKLLTVGAKTSVATKGASPDREAAFECLAFEDDVVPVGHTVWYTIVGTGGPLTVDTAGSDYDTVVAVYTSDGSGGFAPVPGACVDDVPVQPIGRTLQSAVTWNSVAGTTYFVQIGGFPQSFPYGNLRVAVR